MIDAGGVIWCGAGEVTKERWDILTCCCTRHESSRTNSFFDIVKKRVFRIQVFAEMTNKQKLESTNRFGAIFTEIEKFRNLANLRKMQKYSAIYLIRDPEIKILGL